MPDISVCKICEWTLKENIEDLGKVANDAVLHQDLKQTVDDNEEESDEERETDDIDDDGELEVESGEDADERAISNLLQRIRTWQPADIPYN